MSLIRIVVAEPEAVFMRGLTQRLEHMDPHGIEIVGRASTGAEALQMIQVTHPDVALLALHLPDMSALDILAQLRENPVRVIIQTSEDSQDMIYRAIQAGARSYRLKFGSEMELTENIHRVVKGEYVLSPYCLAGYIEASRRFAPMNSNNKPVSLLSDREREVLLLLQRGLTQPEIALELNLTLSTVKTHCRHLYHKLKVPNAMGAVREAQRLGLVS